MRIPKPLRLRLTAVVCLLVVMVVGWSVACGNDNAAGVGRGTGNLPPNGSLCDHPNPGCACDAAGVVADCGRVEETVGSFVMCAMGKTTCDGTHWGACQGDVVVTKPKTFAGGAGLHVNTLGSQGACGTANPCDPYCNQIVDNGCGLDASGLSTADCGLTVPQGGGNLCYCDEPSGGSAALYGNLPAAMKGNTGACTGGANTTCQHDYVCNNPDGGAGTCTPYAISGYNAACTGAPDFTLGMGCTSGTTQELEVCNRGLANANTGTLYVAVNKSNPTSAATTCPFAGPAVPAASTKDGYCSINLATTAIGPGQCVTLNTATSCTASAGGALDFTGGPRFFVVNPSTTVLPTAIVAGYTPLAECAACNNYSAENPGLPGASACTSQICGTVCGGLEAGAGDGGDAGCHTYVSGTVFDPGANVPLPAIAVYQPSGALTAFPAGVTCDTCTSVLSPLVSSTFSDLQGNFALEVTTTSPKVVFQTGRWRRQISLTGLTACAVNNITVANDCKYPGAACLTRLPQTQAEGDIPHIAVVTGSAEPFECTIAKYMGGTSEMGPAGSGKRLELFKDNGIGSTSILVASGTTAAVGVPPLPALSGASPKVSKSGATATISKLSGLSSAHVGKTITLAGAGNAGNNGAFVINAVLSSSKLQVTNAAAVNETGGAGFTWSIPSNGITTLNIGGLSGRTAADVGDVLVLSGAASGGNNGSFNVTAFIDATTLAITNASAVGPDAKNGLIGWSLYSSGVGTPLPDAQINLWPSQAALNAFDEVILQCGGGSGEVFNLGKTTVPASLNGQTYFYNFLKGGGRVFMNHYSANGLLLPVPNNGHAIAPFDNTSSWNTPIGSNKKNLNTKVSPNVTPNVPQANFKTWLTNQTYYGGGVLTTPQGVTDEAYTPTANSFEWLRGESSNNWVGDPGGDITSVFSFDTNDAGIVPTLQPDGGAGAGCGRGVMSAMHVDVARKGAGSSFPAECDFGPDLSANEGTFDYLFFTLSSCAIGGAPVATTAPPPPPAPPPLPGGVTFTRDFHAVCPNGTLPVWQLFNWQASVPFGTSIDFTAQTAPDSAGAPGTFAPASPFSVGTAGGTTSTWTTQLYAAPPLTVGPAPCTVDQHLTGNNACPGPGNLTSQEWLRVTMTFNVSGALSPTLTNWEQLFDCIPAK